jgi:hypothetical protein
MHIIQQKLLTYVRMSISHGITGAKMATERKNAYCIAKYRAYFFDKYEGIRHTTIRHLLYGLLTSIFLNICSENMKNRIEGAHEPRAKFTEIFKPHESRAGLGIHSTRELPWPLQYTFRY